jgi:hypothetical protein
MKIDNPPLPPLEKGEYVKWVGTLVQREILRDIELDMG